MAALHKRCFGVPRPFTAAEFTSLLSSPHCFHCAQPNGLALGRAVAGEAELLTLAVDPQARRTGIGYRLLADFEAAARHRQASRAFLEVAADNAGARRLYARAGYAESGRRRGYYRMPDGTAVDAILMSREFDGD